MHSMEMEQDWSDRAQAQAAHALERLLGLAETRDSGQSRTVVRFIASTFNGQAFALDPFDLRTVDVAISEDMLICLDALRWGRADLYKLVSEGAKQILAVCETWGLQWPDR